MALYGNTSLPFQVHIIQKLILLIPVRDGLGRLQQAIGQSTFSMINVRYNAKVADILHSFNKIKPSLKLRN